MSITRNYNPASLIRRLFAALLDGLCIGLLGSILHTLLALLNNRGPSGWYGLDYQVVGYGIIGFLNYFFTELFGFPIALTLVSFRLQGIYLCPTAVFTSRDLMFIIYIILLLLPLLISPIYHGAMESRSAKATVGKLIMGIFVSDLNGNKISFMRAMFRYLARGLSTLTCGFGYLMALGKTGQALHDKLTGCIILSKK